MGSKVREGLWRLAGRRRTVPVAADAAGKCPDGGRAARSFILPRSLSPPPSRSTRASMRHIIAILLQNEAGALSRVAGLFSTRGYNIESLSVAPTDDPTVSRLTLVTTGSDAVIQQIVNQLNKL